MKRLALLLFAASAFLFTPSGEAAPTVVELKTPDGLSKGQFSVERFGPAPRALLLFVGTIDPPSSKAPPQKKATSKSIPAPQETRWVDFARQHNLAICQVRFDHASATDSPASFFRRTADLLFQFIQGNDLTKLPVYAYASGSGSAFVTRLASGTSNRISAWAVYGADNYGFSGTVKNLPPGLIGVGTIDSNGSAKAAPAFKELRINRAPVTWVSISQGTRLPNDAFEDFTAAFFGAVLDRKGSPVSTVVDNVSKEIVSSNPPNPARTSELPARDLVDRWRAVHQPPKTIQLDVATGTEKFPVMHLILRLPPPTPNRKSPARVFCYAPFYSNPSRALAVANDDNSFWNKFADSHGMAVLTWSCANITPGLKNIADVSQGTAATQARIFDAIAKAWNYGVSQLCREWNLRGDGMLLYGCSAGSNFAQRIAMRLPERFSAVNLHIANGFDRPVPKGGGTLWLVSSGALDPGAANDRRFVDACRQLNYPILLKFFPSIGHRETKDTFEFSTKFFSYVLRQLESDPQFFSTLARGFTDPPYVLDIYNNLTFPAAKADQVPPAQRYPLPSRDFAAMWGRLIE